MTEEETKERIATLERAIDGAAYALDPNQGEQPDPVRAYRWLRTAYPVDHPNYVDPADVDIGDDVDPLARAAVALRLANGDDMSGDHAFECAKATILAYLVGVRNRNPGGAIDIEETIREVRHAR